MMTLSERDFVKYGLASQDKDDGNRVFNEYLQRFEYCDVAALELVVSRNHRASLLQRAAGGQDSETDSDVRCAGFHETSDSQQEPQRPCHTFQNPVLSCPEPSQAPEPSSRAPLSLPSAVAMRPLQGPPPVSKFVPGMGACRLISIPLQLNGPLIRYTMYHS